MKTWEVFKKLSENPNLRFKRKLDGGIYYAKDSGIIMNQDRDFYDSLTFDEDWEEIKEPIPWQEALQTWVDGKNIYVIHPNVSFDEKYLIPGCNTNFPLYKDLITGGRWYIDDE